MERSRRLRVPLGRATLVALLSGATQLSLWAVARVCVNDGGAVFVGAACVAGGLGGAALGAGLAPEVATSTRQRRSWLTGSAVAALVLALGVALVLRVGLPLGLLPLAARIGVAVGAGAIVVAPLGATMGVLLRGRALAWLWAADMLGGALAIVAAPLLAPVLGLEFCLLLGGVLAAGAALFCGRAAARTSAASAASAASTASATPPTAKTASSTWAVVPLAAVTAGVELWLPRQLAPVTSSGLWATTAAVAGALGGAGVALLVRRNRDAPASLTHFARAAVVVTAAVVVAAVFVWPTVLLAVFQAETLLSAVRVLVAQALIAALALAPAAASTTAAWTACASLPARRVFQTTSLAGATVALLWPALTSLAPPEALGALLIALALSAWLAAERPTLARAVAHRSRRPRALAAPVVAFCACATLAVHGSPPPRHDLSRALLGVDDADDVDNVDNGNDRVVFDDVSAFGRVSVFAGDDVSLFIDGKPDASWLGDLETETLLAALPLAFAPDATHALVIGGGSGTTARTLVDLDVNVTMVEHNAAVVRAATAVDGPFPAAVSVVVDDARAVLLRSKDAFDVVTVEPSNLFVADMPRLFSAEALSAMRGASRSRVVVLWVHTYLMSDALLSTLRATFSSVFPQTTLFASRSGDVFFVGSDDGRVNDTTTAARMLSRRAGSRGPCLLAALDRVSFDDVFAGAVRVVRTAPQPLHRDAMPVAEPLALAALVEAAHAETVETTSPSTSLSTLLSSTPTPSAPQTLPARVVAALLQTTAGRAWLNAHADGIAIVDDGADTALARAVVRMALEINADGQVTRADARAAAVALSTPRCVSPRLGAFAHALLRAAQKNDDGVAAELRAAWAQPAPLWAKTRATLLSSTTP